MKSLASTKLAAVSCLRDQDLLRQLLLSLEGDVVYPEKVGKEKEFDIVSKARKQGALFTFLRKV